MAGVVEGFSEALNSLGDNARRALLVAFDSLSSYDESTALAWAETATPIIEAHSRAALDLAAAYMGEVGADIRTGNDDLIISDASARVLDPFDRLGANLNNGMDYTEALAGARSQAEVIGVDSVYRSVRSGLAEYGIGMSDWQRRLSGAGCCQWCMKLSSVVFDTAAQATFGHSHCRCIPVPVDSIGKHNAKVRDQEGFDATAEKLWTHRKERGRLRKSIAKSEERAKQARRVARTNPQQRGLATKRADDYDAKAAMARRKLELLEAPA